MNSPSVAVLFARRDSVYKSIPGCDVFDLDRDARTSFRSPLPVVAHPPCRGWGRLRHFAKCRPDELELGFYAVEQVRIKGGVLEHPASSSLWKAANLPPVGKQDEFGGFTLAFPQFWFGHSCEKSSWFYVCGISPRVVPPLPLVLGEPPNKVELLGKAAREKTPRDLALYLCQLARLAYPLKVTHPGKIARDFSRVMQSRREHAELQVLQLALAEMLQ